MKTAHSKSFRLIFSVNCDNYFHFRWLFGTFIRGFKKEIEIEDLFEPLKEHKSDVLGDAFET